MLPRRLGIMIGRDLVIRVERETDYSLPSRASATQYPLRWCYKLFHSLFMNLPSIAAQIELFNLSPRLQHQKPSKHHGSCNPSTLFGSGVHHWSFVLHSFGYISCQTLREKKPIPSTERAGFGKDTFPCRWILVNGILIWRSLCRPTIQYSDIFQLFSS